MLPADPELGMAWELFNLSANSNGFGGLSADYEVVRDYCHKYELDAIEVWRAIRGMLAAYRKD